MRPHYIVAQVKMNSFIQPRQCLQRIFSFWRKYSHKRFHTSHLKTFGSLRDRCNENNVLICGIRQENIVLGMAGELLHNYCLSQLPISLNKNVIYFSLSGSSTETQNGLEQFWP